MNIGVIGGGSIGLLVASCLAASNHNITVYVKRKSQKEQLNRDGITLEPQGKVFYVKALLVSEVKQEDVIFICVKQYHLADIMPYLEYISNPLVFMQNGMGHVDQLIQSGLKQNLLVATVEHGAFRINNTTVNHSGMGQVNIALLQGHKQLEHQLGEQINSEFFPVFVEVDWFMMLSKKLVVNAVINPITAIFHVKNGAIVKNPYLLELGKKICKEAVEVLELDYQTEWEKLIAVAQNTKDNDSSMKNDVMNTRKTEIDGILGYIISHARKDIPYIQYVYNSIKAIEYQYDSKL